MKKRWFINLGILIIGLLVITGCGKDDVQEVIYEIGLPKEDSPAFKEFMRYELDLVRDATLSYQDHTYTIMRSNIDGLRYFKYTDKKLQNSYRSIFSTKKNKG
ncbi:hypothetical protein [Bacillus haynesii]|uniref:hypothetical protein n=1 Tax=Bacillus haynesii TaxID=1925021 RepID=UPI00227F53F7|nr:hypothetical protein [Bacillus haynesii]MCY9215092.1 hypothetical protein [Bacillus haynesii]MCY9261777.1 hypothetical protein [Bacillus haynesii]